MRILIVGATGLVGQGALQACLGASDVETVRLLVRRAHPSDDARVDSVVLPDFDDVASIESRLQPFDACLYCAGATPFLTPELEYRRVTFDLTLSIAHAFARRNPDGRFLYVSGAGADARSRLGPLRVKGEIEQALAALPIRTVMLRPGGVRPVAGVRSPHGWRALAYDAGRPVTAAMTALLPAAMTTTHRLGRAMVELARMPAPPAVIDTREINRLGG